MMRAAWLRPFSAHSRDLGRNSDASERLQKEDRKAVTWIMLMMRGVRLQPFGAQSRDFGTNSDASERLQKKWTGKPSPG